MIEIRVPSGGIILWSGAIPFIPGGFALCDGNNGTPDLRDRFIVGAGDTYAVDASGGSINHDHDFTSDNHNHTLFVATGIDFGGGFDNVTQFNNDTGTTDPKNHLPPYYSLAYIMKL